jgi:geranylgeranyl diphosphate synthase, type I
MNLPPSHSSPEAGFRTLVAELRLVIDAQLRDLFSAKKKSCERLGSDVLAMLEAIESLTLRGGKRLRPALALAAYRACNGTPEAEPALPFAGCALELLQSYLLIHDDWMDNDAFRRGGPSVHTMLTQHFQTTHQGEASGILAGDFANGFALEVLLAAPGDPTILLQAARIFAKIQQDAVCGQQLDLSGRSENVELMHTLKTGSYTVWGPLCLGATLAGASEQQLATLHGFAHPMGIAFQLRDDLLGCFGDPDVTGKPHGSDLRAGKQTALIAEANSRLSASQRTTLDRVFNHNDANHEDTMEAIEALRACGAQRVVEQRLDELIAQATAHLASDTLTADGIHWLTGAATILSQRVS